MGQRLRDGWPMERVVLDHTSDEVLQVFRQACRAAVLVVMGPKARIVSGLNQMIEWILEACSFEGKPSSGHEEEQRADGEQVGWWTAVA